MRLVWNAAEKDLRRYLRDPLALALWLGIPLLVGGLLSLIMGGSGSSPPTPHLLIADEDGGALSGLLVRVFGQTQQGLRVEEVNREEGRSRIGRGEGTALVVIPKGFADAVLNERPTTLLVVTNPSQQVLPQIVEEGLKLLADGSFYLHRIIGPQIREIAEKAELNQAALSNEEIARLSVSFNETVKRLEKQLFPPVINVETTIDQTSGPRPANFAQLFLPGILFMALVFMAEGLSEDLWRERSLGTLRRAACTPASLHVHLGGKVLAGSLVIFASTLAILLSGMMYHRMPLAALPLAVCWGALAGAVILLLFVLIQLHASSQRAGSILTNSVVMPLLFLGGSFFPFEAMPDWMAAIGRWTPNGWAVTQLKDILFHRALAANLAVAFPGLVAVAAVLFLLCVRRLRSVLARG